jgi:hypothetical protein
MFTLQNGEVCEATPEQFAAWATRENVVVRETFIGKASVHTVFLGTNWGTDSDPVYFITHIAGGRRDGLELRAGNLSSALENHTIALLTMKG